MENNDAKIFGTINLISFWHLRVVVFPSRKAKATSRMMKQAPVAVCSCAMHRPKIKLLIEILFTKGILSSNCGD